MQKHPRASRRTFARAARESSVTCEMIHVEHEHRYQAIIDIAEAKACELVVMASHGRHGIVAVIFSGHRKFQICWSAKGQRLGSDMIDLDQ